MSGPIYYNDTIPSPDVYNPWLTATAISTTGHSLGGGLAGFVWALYDQDATVFDSMTYEFLGGVA